MRKVTFALAVAAGLAISGGAHAARFVINNVDPPGVGFNDPTPATPVGGNPGTTVGEQRRIAFAYALQIWGNTLESDVPIVVQGSFRPRPCTATSGVLASAGTLQIFSNFKGAPLQNHWYHAPLSNALTGRDLTPGKSDPGYRLPPFNDDISAAFNSDLGKPGCLTGSFWYYGLDNKATGSQIDFLNTFLHEVAHGLGFSNFVRADTGAQLIEGLPDVYMANTKDLTTGKQWNTMTSAEIIASSVNDGQVVWTGPAVTEQAPVVLAPYQGLLLTGGVSKEPAVQFASFGAAPTTSNFNGIVELARDSVTGNESLGCSGTLAPFGGKVALIQRGTCAFTIKAKNAQLAGASAVLVYNSVASGLPGMGGADPTVIIPAAGISLADGELIKAAAPGSVSVAYFVDMTRPPIGASRDPSSGADYVRLYAPAAYSAGSSISHFDTVAIPNLIMEPAINADLKGATNLDLTPALMNDIGWSLAAGAGNVAIWACDTTVPKASDGGKQLSTAVTACAGNAKNNGQFQSCVVKAADSLVLAGLITPEQKDATAACAAGN